MESISNSGVSLILNPDLAHAIDDQHQLSTCEEEFENPEEIQQVLANAFDSQSLSDAHPDEDEDEDDDEQIRLLKEENESLRRQLTDSISNEEICRRRVANFEREIRELNEKHEEILFSTRLNFETKFDDLTNRMSEKQIELIDLKQKYETLKEEKVYLEERLNEERLVQKPSTRFVQTQTDFPDEKQRLIDELTDEIRFLQNRANELEQTFTIEKNQYEKRLKELLKRPLTSSTISQTDSIDEEENKKFKQMKSEVEDLKLKLNSKQIEYNTLKIDFDHLKQELNDRLSLVATTTNSSNEQMKKILVERDEYLDELKKLRNDLPNLKQQLIESFQTKVSTFRDQVKKSLSDKENEYRKRIEQIENEYLNEYEQVLEKNKQMFRSILTAKQEEFNNEKTKIINEYEEKLQKTQYRSLSDDERRLLQQKIDELTRTNDKLSQMIGKRDKSKENEEMKRKYNEEIRQLYDQISKLNEQQIQLIDEHQKQIESLKTNYDQRYRVLIDEWKFYNENLHQSNSKLKSQAKDYEKTIVQLRYQILNLQIEYLQNGGNANKILSQ